MIKQYLKISVRNILRNKLFSIINITGLSISIACCALIMLLLKYEFSYDRFNNYADRIYRFTFSINLKTGYKAHFARCATSWIKYIPDEFPEVEKMVTLIENKWITLKINDNKFSLKNAFYVDSTFFNVFSIPLLKGDSNKVLSGPYNVVISESLAKKYFKNIDPVGQTIINTGWHDGKKWSQLYYTVTGVFKDLPANSHFHADLLISKATIKEQVQDDDWKYVYLLFNKKSKPDDFIKNFPAFLKKHEKEEQYAKEIIPHLQSITDIHLKSDKDRELEENSNMTAIYIIFLIGLIIMVVSWVNYLNLNIAGIYIRSRNIYLYKVHGCPDVNIFLQYLVESIIIVAVAFNLAYILVRISFPFLETMTGNVLNKNIFQFVPETIPWILILFAGTLIIGSLPIFVFNLKSSTVANLFKSQDKGIKRKPSAVFRNVLIVFQFALTTILIICTIVINLQGRYIQKKQTGANLEDVIAIRLFNQDVLSRYYLLKTEITKSPYIKDVTAIFNSPFDITMDAMQFETQGIKEENKDKILWVYSADDNYFKFMDVSIIAGNDFSLYNEKVRTEEYILNESAVKFLGWTNDEAIGKPFKLKFSWDKVFQGGWIVGVVKDFNLNTLHHEIKPFVFFQKSIWFWTLQVKIDTHNKKQALEYIKKVWRQIAPDYPFEFQYNNEYYFQAYKKEIVQSRMTGAFSLLAILISCMGLFAISSIIINQRTKEIGIRKTNGAKTSEIIFMLIKDFSKWVVVAFFIACPVAFYFMQKWLENFAYKINIHWWVYALSGGIAFAVAFLTIIGQSYKAATRNPVEALRNE